MTVSLTPALSQKARETGSALRAILMLRVMAPAPPEKM
jgi:hypothetical protein